MFYCDKCENTDCCERCDLPNEPVLCDKCYMETLIERREQLGVVSDFDIYEKIT